MFKKINKLLLINNKEAAKSKPKEGQRETTVLRYPCSQRKKTGKELLKKREGQFHHLLLTSQAQDLKGVGDQAEQITKRLRGGAAESVKTSNSFNKSGSWGEKQHQNLVLFL